MYVFGGDNIFVISPQKHMLWYSLEEAFLMTTHNICFCGDNKNIILSGYPSYLELLFFTK